MLLAPDPDLGENKEDVLDGKNCFYTVGIKTIMPTPHFQGNSPKKDKGPVLLAPGPYLGENKEDVLEGKITFNSIVP